ncbi:hypothetical protein [Nocardioides sp.]|uniref:hypothetical protein n=1 Tax=Nocardioides sp. TaxID=35761 RepID=UPI003569789C
MPRSNEDEAWRAIVDNYGDRAELAPEDLPAPEPEPEPQPDPFEVPAELVPTLDEERFVPPPAPPVPQPPRDRLLAWAGLFGSPAVLLFTVVAGIHLPSLVAYALVGAFIGGFAYLVAAMPKGPHDPFDDGARL